MELSNHIRRRTPFYYSLRKVSGQPLNISVYNLSEQPFLLLENGLVIPDDGRLVPVRIYDAAPPKLSSVCLCIVLACPNVSLSPAIRVFRKERSLSLFMPTWTHEELVQINTHNNIVATDLFEFRYRMFGGSARLVLSTPN